MTFIASVIAKKGVALIADSLVTTSKQVLEFDDFYEYLKSKSSDGSDGEIKFDTKEVMGLFKSKPTHTKDYQEKLFEYDKYTAISTAGAAFINERSVEEIIESAKREIGGDENKPIEQKVQELTDYFNSQVIECLKAGSIVRNAVFIITHFSKGDHTSQVFKLYINTSTPDQLSDDGFKGSYYIEQSKFSTVVCEGQNRISERILWGDIDTVLELIPKVANKIIADFKIKPEDIPKDYVSELVKDKSILPLWFYEDIKISKLIELSLQQAVDLASLLMRLERDIQKYTEYIPTVGGNVKIAIIDDGGFKFVSGDTLTVASF